MNIMKNLLQKGIRFFYDLKGGIRMYNFERNQERGERREEIILTYSEGWEEKE